jgi:hypothetical protein
MLRRAREVGPGGLVPLAWAFTIAAHADVVADHTLFIAHVVMTTLLAVFAVTGRSDMQTGVLNAWWWIIAVGFLVTLAGTIGFQVDTAGQVLQGLAVGGWVVLPAVGFLYTGRAVTDGAWIYFTGAVGCFLGLAVYLSGLFLEVPSVAVPAGLGVVGFGQTIGILDAVIRY